MRGAREPTRQPRPEPCHSIAVAWRVLTHVMSLLHDSCVLMGRVLYLYLYLYLYLPHAERSATDLAEDRMQATTSAQKTVRTATMHVRDGRQTSNSIK